MKDFFDVLRVSRDDLECVGYDGTSLSDEQMERIAYLIHNNNECIMDAFWEALRQACEREDVPVAKDYYRVDREFYDIKEGRMIGDMAATFCDFPERIPCNDYSSDEEFVAYNRECCVDDIKDFDDELIPMYIIYKSTDGNELEKIHIIAGCTKETADKYGFKADSFAL